MARPITVGLDGSVESLTAADWGAREAQRRGLPLHLVNAWDQPPRTPRLTEEPEARTEWLLSVLRQAETDLAARYRDIALTGEQVPEAPVPVLLERARASEMLVLGSRGQGAVAGFLLGSTGLQVLAKSTAPVVLVRRPAEAVPERSGDEIVVGIQDATAPAAAPVEFAFTAAVTQGLPLRAVRAWNLPPFYAYSPEFLRTLDENGGVEVHERKVLADVVRPWREKFPGVPVTEHVELGSAAEVLLSAASRARLLVVGRRTHRPPRAPWLGHVTHAALHHATCPVAVVPHA
jgi:nucleotide-binding universal stress UspA family protein